MREFFCATQCDERVIVSLQQYMRLEYEEVPS